MPAIFLNATHMETSLIVNTIENFTFGLCSAYFIYEAATYFKRRNEQHFYRTAAAIMTFWFLLMLKDPVYSCIDTERQQHIYRTLLLIDMSAVFSCVFFVIELLSPFYITWRLIAKNSAFYLAMLALYIATGNDIFFDLNIAGMVVYCIVWAVRAMVLTRRYHYIVRQNFSYNKSRWLWKIITLFFIVLAAWVYTCYIISPIADIAYTCIVTAVWAVTNRYYRSLEPSINEVKQILSEQSDSPDASADFSNATDILFRQRKLHRNHDLSLSQVAKEIGTNRSYYSAWLNNSLHVNFYDFVNGHRISDAEQLILNSDTDIPQEEIAATVGFNSLSTFRRAFIKKHGMTPRQFREANIRKKG